MKNTFKVGDLVQLKAGGPVMAVAETFDHMGKPESFRCQWFSGKKLEGGVFPLESLQVPVEDKK